MNKNKIIFENPDEGGQMWYSYERKLVHSTWEDFNIEVL